MPVLVLAPVSVGGTMSPIVGGYDLIQSVSAIGGGYCGNGDDVEATYSVASLPTNAIITGIVGRFQARCQSSGSASVSTRFEVWALPASVSQLISVGSPNFAAVSVTATGTMPTRANLISTPPTSRGHQTGLSKLNWQCDFMSLEITYSQPPNAPTGLSPADNAELSTLVPVFQGTHSHPFSTPMTFVQIEVRRSSDNALMWDSGNSAATGSTFSKSYGGTPLALSTGYRWRARTFTGAGTAPLDTGVWSDYLDFTSFVNEVPVASQISPLDGVQLANLDPDFVFGFSDQLGDVIENAQIQVRRVSNGVSMWDYTSFVTGAESNAGQATRNYAGSALTNSVAYEWRVRVQDSHGAWSEYTPYWDFTPVTAPDVPVLTSPVDGSLLDTLTPTISFDYVQGTGGTMAAGQYEVRQGGSTIYQSGDVADTTTPFSQVYGTANPSDTPSTPPALQWGVSYQVRVRSKDNNGAYSAWTAWTACDFTTDSAPTTPTNLTPATGAVTGDTTPRLRWEHNDPNGDTQEVVEIELRKVSDNSVHSTYSPKSLTQSTKLHDVTPALTLANQYKWRIRTRSKVGPGFGPYSNWQTFTVATVPTVDVTAPLAGAVLAAPSFTVTWTYTGGSSAQQDYKVQVLASDGVSVVYDSGTVAGSATSAVVPAGFLKNNESYFVRVTARDNAAQSGIDQTNVSTSWTEPPGVTGLSAVAVT